MKEVTSNLLMFDLHAFSLGFIAIRLTRASAKTVLPGGESWRHLKTVFKLKQMTKSGLQNNKQEQMKPENHWKNRDLDLFYPSLVHLNTCKTTIQKNWCIL